MLRRIGDSHYGLIPRAVADAVQTGGGGGAGDIGAELRIADGQVVVWRVDPGGPSAARGIRPGWIVDAIGDRRPAQELAALRDLEGTPEARIAHTQFLRSINVALDGRPGESVHLVVRDAQDRTTSVDLVRRTRPGTPVQFGNLPPFVAELAHHRIELQSRCVGVIRFNIWMVIPLSAAFDRAIDTMRDCAGIVIDIRGNPGGVAGMVIGVAGHFYETEQTLGELTMRTGELRLYANPRRVDTQGAAVAPFGGPIAVLTDALSVSTSEIFAAAIKVTGRGRLFGETTAGQALPATAVRLPSGDVLMHVVADLTAPDGSRIEGNGVTPDRVVPLRRNDLLGGRDAPLDAAVRWILDGSGGGR
jgi:carboxyl-terminal processing protease